MDNRLARLLPVGYLFNVLSRVKAMTRDVLQDNLKKGFADVTETVLREWEKLEAHAGDQGDQAQAMVSKFQGLNW